MIISNHLIEKMISLGHHKVGNFSCIWPGTLHHSQIPSYKMSTHFSTQLVAYISVQLKYLLAQINSAAQKPSLKNIQPMQTGKSSFFVAHLQLNSSHRQTLRFL